MKPAFDKQQRAEHALQSLVSFSAKRLSLVEQTEMNGLNKEITRPANIRDGASPPFVNDVS